MKGDTKANWNNLLAWRVPGITSTSGLFVEETEDAGARRSRGEGEGEEGGVGGRRGEREERERKKKNCLDILLRLCMFCCIYFTCLYYFALLLSFFFFFAYPSSSNPLIQPNPRVQITTQCFESAPNPSQFYHSGRSCVYSRARFAQLFLSSLDIYIYRTTTPA